MAELYDVAAIGNAIVDVIAPATDDFLAQQSMDKGAMMLVDEARSAALYTAMAPGVEASGGSAANSIAGVASPLFFGWIYSLSVGQGAPVPQPGLAFYIAAGVLALAAVIGWMTARRAVLDQQASGDTAA